MGPVGQRKVTCHHVCGGQQSEGCCYYCGQTRVTVTVMADASVLVYIFRTITMYISLGHAYLNYVYLTIYEDLKKIDRD